MNVEQCVWSRRSDWPCVHDLNAVILLGGRVAIGRARAGTAAGKMKETPRSEAARASQLRRRGEASVYLAASAGFCLLLFGQMFAHPGLSDIAGRLDAVQATAQAGACLVAFAVFSLRPGGTHGLLIMSAASAVLCALGAAAMLSPGTPAPVFTYTGCASLGAGVGLLYVCWSCTLCRFVRETCLRRSTAALSPVAGMAVAMPLVLVARLYGRAWLWAPLGSLCLAGFLAVLAVLLFKVPGHKDRPLERRTTAAEVTARRNTRSGATGNQLEHSEPGDHGAGASLLGAGLASLLFGMVTQIHNSAGDAGVGADVISLSLSTVLLVLLATRIALRGRAWGMGRIMLTSLPIIGLVLVASPLFWQDMSDMSDALVKSFFNLCLACALILPIQRCSPVPEENGSAADETLAAGCMAVVWTCAAAGSVAGHAIVNARSDTAMTAAFLAGTWLCILAAVAVAWRSGQSAERAYKDAREAGELAQNARLRSNVVYVDKTDRQVEALARECGLSAREREVVGLLVQGRSAARIADQLFVSENTVKTRMQNIYAKAGVHTKQELLDRVGRGGQQTEDSPR